MCTFGLMVAICLFWWRYFKRRAHVSEGAMRINELQSSTTQSVELIDLILRERQNNDDESLTGNVSSSRREINFLLARMIGHPPSYEEVTTNDDTTYIYTLFNLEFRVAKDKLVSSSYKYDSKYC